MKQSKKQSLTETVISTFIGLAVSLITQINKKQYYETTR